MKSNSNIHLALNSNELMDDQFLKLDFGDSENCLLYEDLIDHTLPAISFIYCTSVHKNFKLFSNLLEKTFPNDII